VSFWGKKGEDERGNDSSVVSNEKSSQSTLEEQKAKLKPNTEFQSEQTMSDKESVNCDSEHSLDAAKSLEESAEERLVERFGKTRSALGPGTVIQGRLTFDTTVRIDGKLSGDVFSSKAIIVGRKGSIDAQIEVSALIVLGHVKGYIKATERVDILAGGYVEGSIETPCLVVESGSTLNGDCKMTLNNERLHPKALLPPHLQKHLDGGCPKVNATS
jgi:cytoskeletal protein CcmA (bactofilin family)